MRYFCGSSTGSRPETTDMDTTIFSYFLAALGGIGISGLLAATIFVLWYYRGSRTWSFRWYQRNWHLKQLAALASLFFLAMVASYGVLRQPWAWFYLIAAFQTGTWWLRCVITSRA